MAELGMINVGNGLIFLNAGLLLVSAILLVMLGFYVAHYFVLENGVQKLYQLEKEIMKRCRKIALE
jgi:hypothetical protein